jgi:hypothetical protein
MNITMRALSARPIHSAAFEPDAGFAPTAILSSPSIHYSLLYPI